MRNVDVRTVEGFGDEWSRFDQADQAASLKTVFERYFRIFPWASLPAGAVGADFGCGSGRWSRFVAPRVGHLHLIDASAAALATARKNLSAAANVDFHLASFEEVQLPESSLDFGFSLGVLHHLPDTEQALSDIARLLKPGAPFLIYLYYRFDNRPDWYRTLWSGTDALRKTISRLPHPLRYAASQALALGVYWPLARSARALDEWGALPSSWPLSSYRNEPFYTMRTDALDRFGTRLEKRYTRDEIAALLKRCGFIDARFSDESPYWCAVARKA